jgi:arginine/ornithine N-succinyltransferase beta subunit
MFHDNIHAVRGAACLVEIGDGDPVPDNVAPNGVWLVTKRLFESWRALLGQASARLDRFPLLPYAAAQLGVADGELVRAVPLSPRDR